MAHSRRTLESSPRMTFIISWCAASRSRSMYWHSTRQSTVGQEAHRFSSNCSICFVLLALEGPAIGGQPPLKAAGKGTDWAKILYQQKARTISPLEENLWALVGAEKSLLRCKGVMATHSATTAHLCSHAPVPSLVFASGTTLGHDLP